MATGRGGWAFEWDAASTAPAPARCFGGEAEEGWQAHGATIFRLSGIYGPGRNPLTRVQDGTATRILKPGHVFSPHPHRRYRVGAYARHGA